jgi:hypothetical protein
MSFVTGRHAVVSDATRPSIRLGALGAILTGLVGLSLTIASGHWFAFVAFVSLIGGCVILARIFWPPVFSLAFAYQWLQVCGPYFYWVFTGFYVVADDPARHFPYLYIALASVLVLFGAVALGMRYIEKRTSDHGKNRRAISGRTLFLVYLASTLGMGILGAFAWSVSGITQAVLTFGAGRLVVLYMLLHDTMHRRMYLYVVGIMAFEVGLGMTGFFAGFREGLILLVLVVLAQFRHITWGRVSRLAVLGIIVVMLGLLWTGIKSDYRAMIRTGQLSESRVERILVIGDLALNWILEGGEHSRETGDDLMYRFGEALRFQALAYENVPAFVDHTSGLFTLGAVRHVLQPRLFFPDKPRLMSDSDKVRHYAGVWVAGYEEGTSIAFGYAAEAYVDWGFPLMYLPILMAGLFWGACLMFLYRRISNNTIATATVVIIAWRILYLFEQSWAIMVGRGVMTLLVIGGLAILVDRHLQGQSARRRISELLRK